MGQYKSYQDIYLDRELANIEKELISFKTPQIYGTRQVQAFKSNIVEFDASIIFYSTSGSGYSAHSFGCNPTRIRFTGNKPGRTVIAQLKLEVVGSGGAEVHCTYLKALRTSQAHVLDWWIYIGGSDYSEGGTLPTPNRTARCWVMSNDSGVLTIEETHSIHNHYQWISGGYYE